MYHVSVVQPQQHEGCGEKQSMKYTTKQIYGIFSHFQLIFLNEKCDFVELFHISRSTAPLAAEERKSGDTLQHM